MLISLITFGAVVSVSCLAATVVPARAAGGRPAFTPTGTWPQVFHRGTDRALWTTWRDYNGNWVIQRLGGSMAGNPVAATIPGSNTVQVFYRGTGRALWSAWRNYDGTWTGPVWMGGALTGDPSVATVQNGGGSWLQIFYRGSDSALWTTWRNYDGSWSPPQRLGGSLAGNPIAADIPGSTTTQVFFRGNDGFLWSMWRNYDGTWSGPQRVSGDLASNPDVTTVASLRQANHWFRCSTELSTAVCGRPGAEPTEAGRTRSES
jgi:hypothetical protein